MPAFPSAKAKIKLPANVKGQQFPLHPCHVQVTRQARRASRLVRIIHLIAPNALNLTIRKQILGISRHKNLVWFSSSAKQQPAEPGGKMLTQSTQLWSPPRPAPEGTQARQLAPEVHNSLRPVHATGPKIPKGNPEQSTACLPYACCSRRAPPRCPSRRQRGHGDQAHLAQATGTQHPPHRRRGRGDAGVLSTGQGMLAWGSGWGRSDN